MHVSKRIAVRIVVAMVSAIPVASAVVGCSSTCESACDRQYSSCVEKAPPGASRDDCSARQQECYQRCQSSPAPSAS